MWKPTYVVEEHKLQAKLVWGGLLAALVGFTVYQSAKMGLKRRDPDTSFKVSDEIFQFPYVEMCFEQGDLCTSSSTASAADCIDIRDITISDTCGDTLVLPDTSKFSNCVGLDLESLDVDAFEDSCLESRSKPSVSLWMDWITSSDTGGENGYSSSVRAFLGRPDAGQQLTYVPYTHIVLTEEGNDSEARIALTHMTIGKNVRKTLSGSSETSYPALTVATTDYVFESQSDLTGSVFSTTDGLDLSRGFLRLTLNLGSFASTELSDINPTDSMKILGLISSIGGFWGLLLTAWGFIFIATVQHKPEEKARNFKKDIEKGKSFVVRKKSSPTGDVASDAEGGSEEQPNWDIARGGPLPATDTTNRGRVSENGSTA